MSVIVLKDLCVELQAQPILKNINLELHEGDIACLLGSSGCGKTTLLRSVAGFVKPNEGEIWISGVRVSNSKSVLPVEKRQVGMVFQDYALFPHLNVKQNIAFGLNRKANVDNRVNELLDIFHLEEHARKYPHRLSGGQQQRVAIARAMAPRPKILLLDEPFASLDMELREELANELRMIIKQEAITSIMVSHNQNEAFAMADRVGVMQNGELVQWDSGFDLYHEPETDYVADFIGEGEFLNGTVIANDKVETKLGVISGKLQKQYEIGNKVKVLIRPDDILHDDDSAMQAKVISKAFRGAYFLYTLELETGERVLSLVPSHHDHPVNKPIGIRLEIDHLVVFAS